MKRIIVFTAVLFFFFCSIPKLIFASSQYVLPYPAAMPGGSTYKLRLFLEKIEYWWYLGDFAKFSFDLKQSDRYLVQAKTLCEYEQYLLCKEALETSDTYFMLLTPDLQKAVTHAKDISEKRIILERASQKHIEVLDTLATSVPEEVNWLGQNIPLHMLIEQAKNKRKNIL